jgi:NTE family protein
MKRLLRRSWNWNPKIDQNNYAISLKVTPVLKFSPMRTIVVLALLFSFPFFYSLKGQVRPKIGLTLSGGGAKGLAHIGILKAIDSAGLKIDYITGTSMGSVIGGLYAIGYTGDSIITLAKNINWDILLSNQASLRTIFMEEKSEYDKYIVELPYVNHKFQLPTGVLEGQELWLKLSELFFPVNNQKDFSKFPIPFKCVGTDVGNGEAVVMGKGELTNAIRSSMAIPSFFTAVDFEGKRLVDGGIVRNFPVRDVKEMGADLVIGSNVSSGLLPSEQVRNAIQILFQIAFFLEAIDHRQEIPLCDIYIPFNLDKYNMGSFSQADEILEYGIEEGRKWYPKFKHLADSLDAIYGPTRRLINNPPPMKAVKIQSAEVKGLRNTRLEFFLHTIDFTSNRYYTPELLSKMVRAAYGTRYYSRITYSLIPQDDSSSKIIFEVKENPLGFAKVGLHYNKFSGISAILNLTARNYFITNSRTLVTINIGDNLRARAEHLQYIGRRKNFSITMGAQYDQFNVTTYSNYKEEGLYKQQYIKFDIKAQYSTLRNTAIGFGNRLEWNNYKPSINSALQFNGNNYFPTSYVYFSHNSLDRAIYPHRGIRTELEGDIVYRQDPDVKFYLNGIQTNPDSVKVSRNSYTRAIFNLEKYTSITKRSTLEIKIQSGVCFNYERNVMNEFSIGGLTHLFRNQITFAGLPEGSLYSPGLATFQLGLRYEVFPNTYIIGRSNVLFNNLISKSAFFQNQDVITGHAVTFAYNFALGPLEFSLMYSDQSKKISSYVNIGIPF